MNEREKVIKGLECCLPMTTRKGLADCKQCPYDRKITLEGGVTECCHDLMADALALLKEQEPVEPRVMTLEEYRAIAERPLEERVPVWLEWRGGRGRWTIPERAYQGYGVNWRCWTSSHDEKTREAVKWE